MNAYYFWKVYTYFSSFLFSQSILVVSLYVSLSGLFFFFTRRSFERHILHCDCLCKNIFYHSGFGSVPTNTNFTDRTSLKPWNIVFHTDTVVHCVLFPLCVLSLCGVSQVVGNSNDTTESVFFICEYPASNTSQGCNQC